MTQNTLKLMLDTMEAMRILSFRMHGNDINLNGHRKRILSLMAEVKETMNLKTTFDKKSGELSLKLEEFRLLARD
ncbi:MAG: hypothetical protein HQM16_19320 [Deltaproteobacteria bacterium]|nr:hypothetical protein [Deltaproteobacteria bacterium]